MNFSGSLALVMHILTKYNIMERLTRLSDNNEFFIIDNDKINHNGNGYSGTAINRLAKFEDIYDDL